MAEAHTMSGAINITAATADTAAGGGDTAQTSQQPDATPNQAQNTTAQANISGSLRSTTAEAQGQHSEKADEPNLSFPTGWRRYLPAICLYCPHWYCCYCCCCCCFLQSGGRWSDIRFSSGRSGPFTCTGRKIGRSYICIAANSFNLTDYHHLLMMMLLVPVIMQCKFALLLIS